MLHPMRRANTFRLFLGFGGCFDEMAADGFRAAFMLFREF